MKEFFRDSVINLFSAVKKLETDKSVLITFDDGPDPKTTPAVLEKLKFYDARAVFFVVTSQVNKFPQLLKAILNGGHRIGCHGSFKMHEKVSLMRFVKDLSFCRKTVELLINKKVDLFRPPLGRLTLTSLIVPKFFHLKSIYWSVDLKDLEIRDKKNAVIFAEHFARIVRPGDIILFHESGLYLLPILDVFLPGLKARGFDLLGGAELL